MNNPNPIAKPLGTGDAESIKIAFAVIHEFMAE